MDEMQGNAVGVEKEGINETKKEEERNKETLREKVER